MIEPQDALTGEYSRRSRTRRHRNIAPTVVLAVVLAILGISLVKIAASGGPMSVIDEHVHYDYTVALGHDEMPNRGRIYSDEVIWEWMCGVGHHAGKPVSCGDTMSAEILPSGKYSTAYIHYPTYFKGAEGARYVLESVFGERRPIDYLRVFSALAMTLGAVACAFFARRLGLRGWAVLAATCAPIAASMILVLDTNVNPNVLATVAGALVAGTGLGWVREGKGFWWLAEAPEV